MLNSKSLTILCQQQEIYIPPLALTPKEDPRKIPRRPLFAQAVGEPKPKISIDVLKQNTDFLKEKSLYRYYISKNHPRKSVNKSQGSLLPCSKQKYPPILQQNLEKDKGNSFQQEQGTSFLKEFLGQNEQKDKYFKRKSRASRCGGSTFGERLRVLDKSGQINNSEKCYNDLSNENGQLGSTKNSINSTKNICFDSRNKHWNLQKQNTDDSHSQDIRRYIQSVMEENFKLKEDVSQKQNEINRLNMELEKINSSNEDLTSQITMLTFKLNQLNIQIERSTSKTSQSFINENMLSNQVLLREKIIQKMQCQIKYVELQNSILRKAKDECTVQKEVIRVLEKQKKMLEQKVKLLYELGKKKRLNTDCVSQLSRKSIISSHSSLNFSVQDDLQIKKLQPLKTAERTPEKMRVVNSGYIQKQGDRNITLSNRK